ncbi:hypothetical protein [Altererythrobacter sp. Z27]|uniref:hypothetical protein n=1 Tax=Altererythrobacter sp. Z27 TaxID=3461147 RepID=UPI0040448BC8
MALNIRPLRLIAAISEMSFSATLVMVFSFLLVLGGHGARRGEHAPPKPRECIPPEVRPKAAGIRE